MARPTQDLLDHLSHSNTASRAGTRPVNLDDVVTASVGWLVFSLVGAVIGWFAAPSVAALISPMVLLVGLFGLIFIDYKVIRAPEPPVGLMALSLGVYSFYVGIISWFFGAATGEGTNLVLSAAIGTIAAAACIIGLYKARILKAETSKFRSAVVAGGIAYIGIITVSLIMSAFGMDGLFGPGLLGWVLCLFGVTLASASLAVGAADIDMAIKHGVPSYEASRLSWAFVSTLLWLYLEILRLLARARE